MASVARQPDGVASSAAGPLHEDPACAALLCRPRRAGQGCRKARHTPPRGAARRALRPREATRPGRHWSRQQQLQWGDRHCVTNECACGPHPSSVQATPAIAPGAFRPGCTAGVRNSNPAKNQKKTKWYMIVRTHWVPRATGRCAWNKLFQQWTQDMKRWSSISKFPSMRSVGWATLVARRYVNRRATQCWPHCFGAGG